MRIARSFFTSKTTWTGIAAIASAIGAAVGQHMTWAQAGAAIYAALLAVFMRDTVAKSGEGRL